MKNTHEIKYKTASEPEEFMDAKVLFQRYSISLSIDLSFQNFASELDTINVQYNKPDGALLLCYFNNTAAGCVGIRKLDDNTAELKRMYVDPAFRGFKIGKNLLAGIIEIAIKLRYKRIRLDTLPEMIQAQALYKKAGFYEIPPYYLNPVEGAIYMEKIL